MSSIANVVESAHSLAQSQAIQPYAGQPDAYIANPSFTNHLGSYQPAALNALAAKFASTIADLGSQHHQLRKLQPTSSTQEQSGASPESHDLISRNLDRLTALSNVTTQAHLVTTVATSVKSSFDSLMKQSG